MSPTVHNARARPADTSLQPQLIARSVRAACANVRTRDNEYRLARSILPFRGRTAALLPRLPVTGVDARAGAVPAGADAQFARLRDPGAAPAAPSPRAVAGPAWSWPVTMRPSLAQLSRRDLRGRSCAAARRGRCAPGRRHRDLPRRDPRDVA